MCMTAALIVSLTALTTDGFGWRLGFLPLSGRRDWTSALLAHHDGER